MRWLARSQSRTVVSGNRNRSAIRRYPIPVACATNAHQMTRAA
jgi:hypothetical protein